MKIILNSFTPDPVNTVAKSSFISHSNDKVTKIFEKEFKDPLSYIKKIIKMGHLSVLEHIYFNFLIEDAPLINEIFLIRFRLASFTVKSRRYTNVIEDGFYEDEKYKINREFQKEITDFYKESLENQIPLEDARFVLPLSSKTNMVFSANARELGYIIYSGLYEDNIDPIKKMVKIIQDEANKVFPIYKDLTIFSNPYIQNINIQSKVIKLFNSVEVLNKEEIEIERYKEVFGFGINGKMFEKNIFELKESLLTNHNRALEFININIFIKEISIPALTHLLRHRIQSIIVPKIEKITPNYIIPKSFTEKKLENKFIKIIIKSQELERENILNRIVASTTPVLTNINLREMIHIMKLRLCNRAQWEIRNIFIKVLNKLREISPIFDLIGPSCFMLGFCPEGKKTCGKIKEVYEEFKT